MRRYLLAQAQEKLRGVFGYDLVTVPDHMVEKMIKTGSLEKKHKQAFFLISCLDKEMHVAQDVQSLEKHGLLMTVLGLIQATGTKITEGALVLVRQYQLHSFWSVLQTNCGSGCTHWIPRGSLRSLPLKHRRVTTLLTLT